MMTRFDLAQVHDRDARPKIAFPAPAPEMLNDPKFLAIWRAIKHWDINVPGAYTGYCGALGNHARAIFDALDNVSEPK